MLNGISFRNKRRFIAMSLGMHVVACALTLLVSLHVAKVRPVQPETKYFSSSLLISGGVHARWTPAPLGRKKGKDANKHAQTSNLARDTHPKPPTGAPAATTHESMPGDGTDAANANPAFPVFSPRPPVSDRSLLPSSEQQVVIDVKVSAIGEVLEATLVKGIGNGLDKIVLDTVKNWRFHPATLNGNPVPTEAELVFPFNQSYPTTPS
jgi:TonB family protein